jgi:hypothetical protein
MDKVATSTPATETTLVIDRPRGRHALGYRPERYDPMAALVINTRLLVSLMVRASDKALSVPPAVADWRAEHGQAPIEVAR